MTLAVSVSMRALEAFLGVGGLAFSAYVYNHFTAHRRQASPPEINLLILAHVFSLLSIAYLELAPRFLPRLASAPARLAVEGLNAVFYLAGFIGLAVYLGSLTFCTGSVCSVARADDAFAAVQCCAWAATAFLCGRQSCPRTQTRRTAGLEPKQQMAQEEW